MAQRGRGGKREGTPGKAYANRGDLATHQAPRAAPGQPYGQAAAQLQAQAQMPLPTQAAPAGGMAPPPNPVAALPGLADPTHRPDEPLTAGLPTGAGPGPAALAPPNPLVKAAATLNALGDTADPATKQFREWVNATVLNASSA